MRLAIGFLTLVLCCTALSAQQPPASPPDPEEMTPAQVQDLFDAMIVLQAQDTLMLSEQQYAQFLPRLKVLQSTKRRYVREHNRLINELGKLVNPRNAKPGGNEADIKPRLDALLDLDSRYGPEVRKAYAAIDSVLDVNQQARFRVLEEQIERKKLEMVARARVLNRQRQQQLQQQKKTP